jgi:hypothetical protein
LSLYHFMPITHVGFDYVETSHDTLSAFRNFITTVRGSLGITGRTVSTRRSPPGR